MKKMMKRFAVLAAVIFLLGAMAIPALADSYDFGPAIEEFESTPLNTISLEVGQTDKPGASLWMDNGMATAYSSDEAVVTVAEDGTVTAVGEGTAYVVFCVNTLEKMYRYDVTAIKEEAPDQPVEVPGVEDVLEGAPDEFKDKWDAAQEQQNKVEAEIAKTEGLFAVLSGVVAAVFAFVAGVIGIGIPAVSMIFGVLFLLAVIVRSALLVWICTVAPRAGMAKTWGLLALASAIAGIVMLIIIYSKSKKSPASDPTPAPVENICPSCGTVHQEDAKWCRNCGTKLQ